MSNLSAPFSILMTSGTHGLGLRACFASLALRFREKGIPTTIFAGPGEQYQGLRDRLERSGCEVVSDLALSMASTKLRREAVKIMLAKIAVPRVVLLGFSVRDAMVFRHVSNECKRRGVDCLSTVQVYSLGHKRRLWPLFYLLGVQLYRISVDHVFVASEIEKRKMIAFGLPASMCSVAHLAIDDEWTFNTEHYFDNLEATVQMPWLCEADGPLVVFLGQFNRIKRQSTLVKMMPYLLDRFPSAKLVLAGDGPYRSKCEQLARSLGLNNAVIFPGRLPQSNVPHLLRRADIAAVPSLVETFGYCIAEPLLYDVPVVSTLTGIAGELSKIGAVEIFERNSPHDAANRIIKCLSEPDKTRERTALGKKYVLENCLSGPVAERMLKTWMKWFDERRVRTKA